ncbi:eukaryotic translation initiation factor 2-alpha kinase-like [Hyposmocoma kahamanoa]|uniref:eukaryotic translation initiation factor 2-alpha kinase-like n=1 Tax=Hyposmocoma kahamanoa TaxID=1477025 RepID=UPI000E6D6F61|nr:eukaryotic translation initiation factor 2-alpha kinase-like [Hyposmocoma kahamanoa]
MSGWYWRVIALKAAFVLSYCASYLRADDNIQKLPFCNPANSGVSNDLVIVSTIDGRLTAFATHNGMKAWHIETQPLLSSNLHHVELTAGGKWVRLVPSLRGTLYSLSGDTVEPLPVDAEQLLSSSFKYSDDLVIAGARETLWLGVDANTGGVLYECGTSGCSSEQQTAGAGRDVLMLRRHSNTVRALDPRSGTEKWNFSVAEHQLAVSRRECVGTKPGPPNVAVAVAIALPEGVLAITRPGERQPLWQQQLDAPIAAMWRLCSGSLQHIDVLWEATRSLVDREMTAPPSLYIGVHDHQLYIQESTFYAQKLETAVVAKRVPWKLVTSRPLLDGGGDTALSSLQNSDPNTLSLITLYGNTGQTGNHGFFLYLHETCDQAVQVSEDALDEIPEIAQPNSSGDHSDGAHHVHIHVYSLWFWWKEVLLITISSALLMNLMIWPRFFAPKVSSSSPLPMKQEVVVLENHYGRHMSNSSNDLSSRFENDFEPLRCLGKGGFGVVFEARNNIDDRHYAVKRITLPKQAEKRNRVLREVKALAQLDHEHIVRYFNAWVEEPPPQRQQQRDAEWVKKLEGGSALRSEEWTVVHSSGGVVTPASLVKKRDTRKPDSVLLNMQRPIDDCFATGEKGTDHYQRQRSLSYTDSCGSLAVTSAGHSTTNASTDHRTNNIYTRSKTTQDEDSYIVFEESKLSEARNPSDKALERVLNLSCPKSETNAKKKKKGHTRHWSLDMVVRDSPVPEEPATLMYLYIQMQLCKRDSLYHWLLLHNTWESRGDEVVRSLFSQIVSAVEYVHSNKLIHRDLKPRNILFSLDGRVKVGDFGLVTTMGDCASDGPEPAHYHSHQHVHTKSVGTKLYMSPEQRRGDRNYDFKVDIYSLGLILFEFYYPFSSEHERVKCLNQVRDGIYPKQFHKSHPEEMEVLKLMLSEDPSLRPTAAELRTRPPLYEHPIVPPCAVVTT